MQKILVPYNDSDPSRRALEQAIEMSKSSKSEIILLYVIDDIKLPSFFETPRYQEGDRMPTIDMHVKEIYHMMKEEAQTMLRNVISRHHGKVKMSFKIAVGDPRKKILELANEEKVSMIVIGTTNLRGISKLRALGSVARSVSENAKHPVLLVH